MKKGALKQRLIEQIELINDESILNHIEKYISINFSNEKIYQLSEEDIDAITLSDVEFTNQQYITNSELKKKINSWL